MVGIVLAGLAALTLACAQQPPADSLVVTDDAQLRRVASEILPELAERSGLELREPVRIARRSRAELQRYLAAQLDEEMPPAEAALIARSYHLLGMVPEGMDLRALLLSVYTEQVAGFYDPDSTALFVMDDQPAEALRTVLIHELVHAVQDQAVDLDSLTARERGNDRQTAALAAIEGHATLVMFEYVTSQQMGRDVDLNEIPGFTGVVRDALQGMRDEYPVLADAPRVVQESILFPYLEGTTFVQRLWREAGGRPSPLGELLPRSTEQVTVPEATAPVRDEPTELGVTTTRATRYTNTLGAMETGIFLTELGVGADAARGWDGDRFALVDGPDGPALAWWSVWDDAAARDRFVAAVAPRLERLPRPARIAARDLGGRPAALLEVGDAGPSSAVVREAR